VVESGAPGGIRTHHPQFRSLPLSLFFIHFETILLFCTFFILASKPHFYPLDIKTISAKLVPEMILLIGVTKR